MKRTKIKCQGEELEVPVLHDAWPWVVTPSQNPENPGFGVTFGPLGLLAWPHVGEGIRTLSEAKARSNALQKIWREDHLPQDNATLEQLQMAVSK